ncbi:MAG: sensor histidine kinase [Planctomycetota bacterium]|nr:MAG: sensor histidine kinase [Planctomycetota bacterium]
MPKRIYKFVKNNPRVSLRLRLTLWICVIFTIIQWVAGGVFWLYERDAINRINLDRLAEQGGMIVSDIQPWLPDISIALLDSKINDANLAGRFERFYVDVFDASGRSIIPERATAVDPETIPIDRAVRRGVAMPVTGAAWNHEVIRESPAELWALLMPTTGPDNRDYVVFVATSDQLVQDQLGLVRQMLFTWLLAAPVVACVSGWFIAGIAVAPFARLQDLAKQFSPDSIGRSIDFESSNAEVSELVAQLDDSRRRIHEAFAAQERFLSNVSHEIKTPIAVMRMEAQTLDLKGAKEEVVYFVDSVKEEMKRLGNLVESFLTLTRIQDGKGLVRGRRYVVNDLVMDSVEHCAVMANQNRVWLRPELFSDDALLDAAVAGEPELLTTMLDNLIRNAIRFCPPEAGVRVMLRATDDAIQIAVQDEGPGIPEDKIATIFDRFSQAGNDKRAGRGHGLGLAIARGIAELHGGTITARNMAESGCEFLVILPRADRGGERATTPE